VPGRYGHLTRIAFRYAGWDLSRVYLADERTGHILCRVYPVDKHGNADGKRRGKEPPGGQSHPAVEFGGMAPLLRKLIADYAVTGLPPAYLPKNENTTRKGDNRE
jgi:putative transposase